MQKHQFNQWIHADIERHAEIPKVFVIGCADLSTYQLAVEFKHKLEPIREDDKPMSFSSLEVVKQELLKLGLDCAYLRLHNAYDECGSGDTKSYCDIELSLKSH
ncbi:hypothetical protein A9264_08710 [Vibrio sp. UCD-FRSSP16_10]|uniref:DUF6482 family protein n=1 Tax=unclassified Vibrio TaxID=2614977 RepID=UPI0007FDBCDE|nr:MULTISPECIES: DUF6482 family protein [unclassified Vibrio]OBT06641.1 hypothetical protein A9260_09495 [Vibrio sp. UCD-FRSSP16_30]OBT12338.1 hypothetical protein A9264_08710 [Vibrio sp. UCD-FRSSP16_10]